MPRRSARPKSDTARRTLRTGFQAITVQVLIQAYNAFAANDVTTEQAAILTVVGTPLLSFLQNWLESHGAVPEMLKGKPPTPAEAVTDLTPQQMLATAEYLRDKALRESAEPPIFTEQQHSPARAGTAPRFYG